MKQVRQVTKSVAPRTQAVWALGDLYAYLACWAYEVYDSEIHPALGMTPRETYQKGLLLSGERAHLKIPYNDDFRFLSLATTRKGSAVIEPGRGIRINYVYYWSESFRTPTVERTQVPVRYDPFNIGLAYAYVQGRWVQCLSEHYLQLRGHTERELQMASAELHKRHQNHEGDAAITAKRLAELLAAASEYESVLLQRLQDLEGRKVSAQLGGYRMELEQETISKYAVNPPLQEDSRRSETQTLYDDDLENLDEYGEYH